jgi:tetratricopeptide (TPR) repeat protein
LKYLKDFCPSDPEIWGKGKMIITTRNENIKTVRYLGEIRAVSIGELEEEEKARLFENASGLPQSEETRNFLKQIPSYPLDVCSAACYVKSTGVSLSEYLKRTREISEEFLDISSRLMSESSNYDRTRYGIVTSNFREIFGKNKLFGELLTLICFFDSQKIPLKILRRMNGAVVADDLISHLKQYSAISCERDEISIHRSAQSAGLDYLLKETRLSEKIAFMKKAISLLTPCERLEAICDNLSAVLPHLESFLRKMDQTPMPNLERCKIDLLLTIGDIYRFKEPSSYESLKYFKRALEGGRGRLSEPEIASINFKIGGALSRTGKNDEAMKYLSASLDGLKAGKRFVELAHSYCTVGVIDMRKNLFNEANENFQKAIKVLDEAERASPPTLDSKLARVCVYRNMALNYFTDGIDRGNAEQAIELMKKAVETLLKEGPNDKTLCNLVSCKSRLAGIYNAFGEYDLSLKEGMEAETLIERLSSSDNGAFCAKGILLLKRGVSYLRLDRIKEAQACLKQAKAIFSKAIMPDYLFRLKAREIEVLIGLNRLEEAFSVCEEIFAWQNRERNNYCDLLFYSRYYCAALIKYRQNDLESAQKYFQKFFCSMKKLCAKIVPKAEFEKLIERNAFEENPAEIKSSFENALKVFEAACGKDRGFLEFCARNKI